ncbi:MAG TPA: hypothetical protein VHX88_06355 [Solirubrobacteraceae bacterium]|jgi:hypothetical protein|nr:hypothetical protein [Solirubrobacteraceae bacterium]
MAPLFGFVQFEFTHALGPHAGRYLVANHDVVLHDEVKHGATELEKEMLGSLTARSTRLHNGTLGVNRDLGSADVLVITVRSADLARLPRVRRRGRWVPSTAEPEEVSVLLATFIRGTEPVSDGREAERILDETRGNHEAQREWVVAGMSALNRAIRAYRVGARDPYILEVTPRDPRKTRIGFGSTEEVADGRWRGAIELPPPAVSWFQRAQLLRPFQTLAEVLTWRQPILESEDLILRALLDLDTGRTRAAAQQVRAALALLGPELAEHDAAPGRGVDLDSIPARLAAAESLAETALERPLEDSEVAQLEQLIRSVATLLEAWRYDDSEPT